MEESLALALEHGFHEQAARVYTNLGEYAVVFKDFALAERVLAEGLSFDTRHDLDSWTHYLLGRQAQLRMEQGRLREAETIAEGVFQPGVTDACDAIARAYGAWQGSREDGRARWAVIA